MKYRFIKTTALLLPAFLPLAVYAQHPEVNKIMEGLSLENQKVVASKCGSEGQGMIISNRGINRFFTDKIGSYLSEGGDVSLFKNYATINTSGGELSINHNLGKMEKITGRHPLTTIGFRARMSDGFATVFSDKKFRNDLGFSVKRTWFGNGTAIFSNHCNTPPFNTLGPSQKAVMNSKRSFILHSLQQEMENKTREFEAVLEKMQENEFENPGDLEPAKKELREGFFKNLKKEYESKFAEMEARALSANGSFERMGTSWTSLTLYIPLTQQQFSVAPSFGENFADEELYAWKLNLSYNEILESNAGGRFFLIFEGGVFQNNTVNTKTIRKVKLLDYKNRGGTDTLRFAELGTSEAYVGSYEKFVTPQVRMQFVWFPKASNAGLSISMEKNFGKYHALNGKLGMPIRFNDKRGDPAVNFELQFRGTDINRSVDTKKSFGKRLSVGFSVGLPFSSRIF